MYNKAAIKLVATLATTLAIAGCADSVDCPAPTAEPVRTAATIAAPAPVASAQPGRPGLATKQPHVSPETAKSPAAVTTDDEAESIDVDADLYVKRLVIARGVKGREPVEPTTTFAKGDGQRIYAFVEIGNRDAAASEVFVSFKPKSGAEGGRIRLRVGASSRWRTWAFTKLAQDTGEWQAIVRNARGDVIGTQHFTITDPAAVTEPAAITEPAVITEPTVITDPPAVPEPASVTDDPYETPAS